MTPEERQRTMDFILASHASSAIRMDRLEENQARHERNMSKLEQNLDRLEHNLDRLEADTAVLQEQQKHQRETLNVLAKMIQDFLKSLQALANRTKRLETRVDSVEEMTRVFRELLERGLRPPEGSTS